jgi:glutaredoxin 3
MILYVKNWCPWCVEAVEWLDVRGYHYRKIDVLADAEAFEHMKRISGQRRTPTLETEDGKVLADFDVIQLEKFLAEHNILP